MARYGAKSPLWAPIKSEADGSHPDYGTGLTIGKLVTFTSTPNYAEGSLYADNGTAEYARELKDVDITMETDDLIARNAAAMYGAQFEGDDLIYGLDDNPPYGGFAFYHTAMRNGKRVHIGHFFPKARASRGARTFDTKGDAITFGTEPITMKAIGDNKRAAEIESEAFDTEEAAFAWCASKVSLGAYYKVTIQQQGGNSSDKFVDTVGTVFVADGSSLEIKVTGYESVTAAYDNGEDKAGDITGGDGTYKLSSVKEDHNIVIVFGAGA